MALTANSYVRNGKTHISIRETDPDINIFIDPVIDGEFDNLTNTEAVAKGLEWFASKYIPEYATQLTNRKVEELNEVIKQSQLTIDELESSLKRSDEQYERVENLLKLTTATVNNLVMSLMPDEEEEATEDEPETETY
ncbi:hypothetical protein GRB29_01885 [Streptococcus pneumoniae]|nr:hypothetical protein [Streptococcus pneumoniae]